MPAPLPYHHLTRQAAIGKLFRAECFESDPWKLSVQWHLWADGTEVFSAVRSDGLWSPGPPIGPEDLRDGVALQRAAEQIRPGQTRPLGVILHLNDELAVTPIKPQMAASSAWRATRALLRDDPGRVIDERPVPDAVYGLLPFPGSDSAVAIRQAQDRLAGIASLRRSGREIRATACSAPLELVTNLAWVLAAPADASLAAVTVAIYRRLTLIAIVSARGVHSLVGVPTPAQDVQTTALGRLQTEVQRAGVQRFELWIWDLTRPAVGDETEVLYRRYFDANPQFFARATEINFAGRDELWNTAAERVGAALPVPIEFFPVSPVVRGWLRGERSAAAFVEAARQNLLAPDASRQMISAHDNALVVGSWLLRGTLGLSLAAGVAVAAVAAFATLRSPAWNLDVAVSARASAEALRLNRIQSTADAWSEALMPRSQAWWAMEVASRLLPEHVAAVLSELDYAAAALPADPDNPAGRGTLEQRLTLRGSAPWSARPYLDALDGAAAQSALDEIANLAGRPVEDGTVQVRVDAAEASPAGGLPLDFTVTLTNHQPGGNLPPTLPALPPLSEVLRPAEIPPFSE